MHRPHPRNAACTSPVLLEPIIQLRDQSSGRLKGSPDMERTSHEGPLWVTSRMWVEWAIGYIFVYNTIWCWWYIFYFVDKKTKVRLDIPQVSKDTKIQRYPTSIPEWARGSRGKLWVLGWVEVPDLSLRSRCQMSAGIIEFPWSNYNRWQVAVQCTAVAII